MKKQNIQIAMSVGLISLGFASTADAALVSRLGGLAYYDTVADLTWLADANYAQTSGYTGTGVLNDGRMTWQAANDWAAQLKVGGVSGWRLADTVDKDVSGCNFSTTGGTDCGYNVDTSTGELANLYYNVLRNLGYYDTNGNIDQPGWGLQNTGPFSNVQSFAYWSATEYAPQADNAWSFSMVYGVQYHHFKSNPYYGWAVQTGDVSAVPVPAAAWLFGSGLLGLIGVARRRHANI